MKVLHVYKSYLPENSRGIPRVIRELSEGMNDQGIESSVFCLSSDGGRTRLPENSQEVIQARRQISIASSDFSFSAYKLYSDALSHADIVNYHFPWPQADVMHLLRAPRLPAIATYHSDIVRQSNLMFLYRPVMNRFLKSVDAIVATSPEYLRTSPVLRQYAAKTTVIPIGIGERQLPGDDLVADWRSRLGSDFFLFVGANVYYKGLPHLVEAARTGGTSVVIAGPGTENLHADTRFLRNVILLGEISDADREALLELCRALVLPSNLRSEAYGLVLAEAARAGKPMITCEIGTGTSFVNRDGQTGLVVQPNDPSALAVAMNRLDRDPELANRLGRNARQRFDVYLRARQMCEAYTLLYQGLIATRNCR